ncbi:hypothetical protein BHE74_00035873 [Ensete ventricosum]|nr:hypothetical protein BHE74_00035873 [Ensete ventricosum]
MAEGCALGTTDLKMAEKCVLGATELKMAKRHISGTTGLMLAKRHVLCTTGLMMAKGHVLGTIGLMMAERHVSGMTGLMLAERHVSGTTGLMLAERHVSGTIDIKMVESHASDKTILMLLKSVHREHPLVEGNPSPFPGNPGYDREVVGARLSLASRGAMDLNVLWKKSRMPGGRALLPLIPRVLSRRWKSCTRGASGKRPVGSPTLNPTATGRPGKWVKIATRRHKAHPGKGSSRRATWEREPKVSVGDTSSTYRRPKSMRDLCGMRVWEDDEGYYVL